jgi:hypothetical protein
MGGSASRDNFAAKILVRYSANVWRMLVGTTPIPRAPKHAGRGHVVIGDEDRVVQLVNMSADEAREFAFAGNPVAPEEEAAGLPGPGPVLDTQIRDNAGADLASSMDSPQDGAAVAVIRPLRTAPRYLTQAELSDMLGMQLPAFIKWRQRCRSAGDPLPEPEYFSGRPGWTDEQAEEIAARRSPESGAL